MSLTQPLQSIYYYRKEVNKLNNAQSSKLTNNQCIYVYEMVMLAMFLLEELDDFEIDMCLENLIRYDGEQICYFGERCIISLELERDIQFDHDEYLNKFNDKLNMLSSKFDNVDMSLIVENVNCSPYLAATALINNNFDLVDAIMKIT